jgi:predicted N-acetyltransferase YhbS
MNVRSRLKESVLIVAEAGGKLAGTVTLIPKPPRSSPAGWPEGWAGIRLLAVDPAYRGRGIGQALMEECVRRCRLAGARAIALHTSGMMDVARRMYERMGFQRVPRYDFHPAPGVVVMAYKLALSKDLKKKSQ